MISCDTLFIHLKDRAAGLLWEIERRAGQSSQPDILSSLKERVKSYYPDRPSFVDDKWYESEVDMDSCYFAHGEFRGCWVPKDERFVDFVEAQRSNIQLGTFPCSSEIRAPWSWPVPPPLLRKREKGYYVLDGQLRVIRHCYHKVRNVKVFIYRGECKDSS